MKKCPFVTKALSTTLVATLLLSPAVSIYAAVPNTQEDYNEVPFVRAENGDLYLTEAFQNQSDFWLNTDQFTDFPVTELVEAYSAEPVLLPPESSSEDSSSTSSSTSSNPPSSSSSDSSSSSSASSSTSESDSQISDDDELESNTRLQSMGPRDFVERLYELVLGRPSDEGGLAHWTNDLVGNNFSAAFVAQHFFHSDEFLSKNVSDEEYVQILYLAILDRPYDQSGYEYWLSNLDCGVSRDYVLCSFIASVEFRALCEQYSVISGDITLTENRDKNISITRFITRLYRIGLGREGGASELNAWTGSLLNGSLTGGATVSSFLNSTEHLLRNLPDTEFIEMAYQVMLGRSADEGGVSSYLYLLSKDHSRNYVLASIASSPEFYNICQNMGISVGSISIEPRDQNEVLTQFVKRTFSTVLNRPIDVNALNEYTSQFLNGQTTANYFAILFGSQEFKDRNLSNTQITQTVYLAMLNRDADPTGLSSYTSLLNRYVSTLYIVSSINSSSEFKSVCDSIGIPVGSFALTEARDQNLSVTDVAVNAYLSLLGRAPDIGGLNNLCINLSGKSSESVLNLLFGLTQSYEFKLRNLNSENYIIAIFTALCGRAPGPAEISVWQNLLTQDNDENRQSVFFLLGASSPCSSYLGTKLGISNFTGQEKGIDVSAHQGIVDWTQVAAQGYTFAFIRAVSSNNSGPFVDPYFYQNVRNAKAAGLKVGVYFYSYAKTTEYVIQEVNTGLNAIHTMEKEGYTFDYPIVLDMEEFKTSGPDWVAIANLGLVIIDQQGYYPCLYSYANAFKNGILNMNDSRLKGYDLWVAHYGVSAMSYPGAIWQYTSSGSVSGVNGRCDLNVSYRDFATIIRNAGKNRPK